MEQIKNKSKYAKIGPGPFKCVSCLEVKDKTNFSRKQILNDNRNCRDCVDKIVEEYKIQLTKASVTENTNSFPPKRQLCYNCKKRGHKKSECTKKGGGAFSPGGLNKGTQ